MIFIEVLKNDSIREIILPVKGLKRKIDRPKFRYIDTIVQDLLGVMNIDHTDKRYFQPGGIKASDPKAVKIVAICELYREKILDLI